MAGYWEELERPAPDSVQTSSASLRVGSRVRLAPGPGGDIFDLALAGRTAVIEAIEQDTDDRVTLAVVVEDDPGRDLGFARQPGHRFFFSPAEVEPLGEQATPAAVGTRRILVAGIGNVFLGDDGFGVALVDRLARRALPPGVEAVDFGIRGMDLAFAMQDGYDAVILLDATPRGERPGTLYVIELGSDADQLPVAPDAHDMAPAKVLSLVRSFGGLPPPTYVIGCEPQTRVSSEGDEDCIVALSEPVLASIGPAISLVEDLLVQITGQDNPKEVSQR
jgi:hydrogenase maturation protease